MIAGHCIVPSVLPWLGWLLEKLRLTRSAYKLCQAPPAKHKYDQTNTNDEVQNVEYNINTLRWHQLSNSLYCIVLSILIIVA